MLSFDQNNLVYTCDGETLRVEPWGRNAFRIRAGKQAAFPEENGLPARGMPLEEYRDRPDLRLHSRRTADRSGLPAGIHARLPPRSEKLKTGGHEYDNIDSAFL